MARKPAPDLDAVALICLILAPDGVIEWGNAAGKAAGKAALRSPGDVVRHFVEIVHPDDRTHARALLTEAAIHGRAERTLRILSNASREITYLHCTFSRASGEIGVAGNPPGADDGIHLLLQGWDVTRWVVRERELHLQAHQDPLTGVANRLAFMTRLDQELGMSRLPSSDVAVLYADVDDFKAVNDARGHEVGDRVLVELAGRLQASLRPGDLLGRLGGDEFAMICPDLVGWPAAIALIERLRAVAAEAIPSSGGEIGISISVGAAFADDRDDRPGRGAALLARADEQMFHRKPRPREGEARLAGSSVYLR